MSLRHAAQRNAQNRHSQIFKNDSQILLSVNLYAVLRPSDKSSSILDIGYGWWMVLRSLFEARLHEPFGCRVRD